MGFQDRLRIAKAFEDEVERYLSSRGGLVAKNGTEHTHPHFAEKIRSNGDPGAKFVRFAPDGVFLRPDHRVIHWEAKASKNIEKDAYDTYISYQKIGCTVIVFVKNRHVYWQRADMIKFVPSEHVVSRYPKERRHPIIDGWICPRNGHGFAGRGSGTPYKEIDFSSMRCLAGKLVN